ncbi:alanine--glyoxylate aminotransferase-like isoform X2 [Homarus americanus]|uniref:Alanine--glyoxylate aminotransferase n=1 Tax=Homarus americanus TaxID=6706 RepID=A0A8J5N3R9_HOMAM|nr:alanine--glyoxylate aminotransferase-like isoform X2 [Homarus americanus]XP_042215182.1 alanine--glyoxylate aminotransferase-like isoform X2 [Homarus americanus]XP_042215183.1 alanine--glyoxylate aminotransferase-like isoform X2 [Homarus americanus]KAG7172700.1 Serine--pyruvate aminotransferase-like [Homarus americanus]
MFSVGARGVRRVVRSMVAATTTSTPRTATGVSAAAEVIKMDVSQPQSLKKALSVPNKLLMGPGPVNIPLRVHNAMMKPMLGHLHPEFTEIMDEVKEGLRYIFQTKANVVCCVSGTGHAGMEATMCNLIEPNDVILIAQNGIWGERAADMAHRHDGDVRVIEKPAGDVFSLHDLDSALSQHKPAILFMVQGESSTGALQPLEGVGSLCRKHGTLLAVDTVASLGGVPFYMDAWEIDVVYTGSQKVISAPPSMAPMAFNDRAMAKVHARKTPIRSFYTDITWLANYWGCDGLPRKYHHTGPVSSVYALREALSMMCEEGLESLWSRHRSCAQKLYDGLADLGLQLFVDDPAKRTPTVTTICVPNGVDWTKVTKYFMSKYRVEISGGLGPSAGKVWRVGLMGYNCTPENVDKVLSIMKEALANVSKLKSNL